MRTRRRSKNLLRVWMSIDLYEKRLFGCRNLGGPNGLHALSDGPERVRFRDDDLGSLAAWSSND